MKTEDIDREFWLTKASNRILTDIIGPITPLPTDRKFRVSVGFTGSRSSRAIAVCWTAAASEAGENQIFVTPTIDDSSEVLQALAHELIHYTDDCKSGHRNHFARVARKIGLEGKLTATYAGDALKARLMDIILDIGDIPHDKLNKNKSGIKRQTSRMLKCQCAGCGFTFRASRAQLEQLEPDSPCPVCIHPSLEIEDKE